MAHKKTDMFYLYGGKIFELYVDDTQPSTSSADPVYSYSLCALCDNRRRTKPGTLTPSNVKKYLSGKHPSIDGFKPCDRNGQEIVRADEAAAPAAPQRQAIERVAAPPPQNDMRTFTPIPALEPAGPREAPIPSREEQARLLPPPPPPLALAANRTPPPLPGASLPPPPPRPVQRQGHAAARSASSSVASGSGSSSAAAAAASASNPPATQPTLMLPQEFTEKYNVRATWLDSTPRTATSMALGQRIAFEGDLATLNQFALDLFLSCNIGRVITCTKILILRRNIPDPTTLEEESIAIRSIGNELHLFERNYDGSIKKEEYSISEANLDFSEIADILRNDEYTDQNEIRRILTSCFRAKSLPLENGKIITIMRKYVSDCLFLYCFNGRTELHELLDFVKTFHGVTISFPERYLGDAKFSGFTNAKANQPISRDDLLTERERKLEEVRAKRRANTLPSTVSGQSSTASTSNSSSTPEKAEDACPEAASSATERERLLQEQLQAAERAKKEAEEAKVKAEEEAKVVRRSAAAEVAQARQDAVGMRQQIAAAQRQPTIYVDTDIKIIKKLGNGSFGDVYEAEVSLSDGRRIRVAVKRMIQTDAEAAVELLSEASVLVQLTHENIIEFYGLCLAPLQMVMQLADGNLCDYLYNRPSIEERMRVLIECLRGFAYLHSQKIIHRDIKSQNILMIDGHVKISDLGLAKALKAGACEVQTENPAAGTPLYLAPELFPDAHTDAKPTFSTDTYSIGILSIEILLCTRPYAGRSRERDLRLKIINGERPSITPDAQLLTVEHGQAQIAALREIRKCIDLPPSGNTALSVGNLWRNRRDGRVTRPTASDLARSLEGIFQGMQRQAPAPARGSAARR